MQLQRTHGQCVYTYLFTWSKSNNQNLLLCHKENSGEQIGHKNGLPVEAKAHDESKMGVAQLRIETLDVELALHVGEFYPGHFNGIALF